MIMERDKKAEVLELIFQATNEELYGIYPYEDGYLVHGVFNILRFDSDGRELWSFAGGGEVFCTRDIQKYPPFKIKGDTIELYDWNHVHYLLDVNGHLLAA